MTGVPGGMVSGGGIGWPGGGGQGGGGQSGGISSSSPSASAIISWSEMFLLLLVFISIHKTLNNPNSKIPGNKYVNFFFIDFFHCLLKNPNQV